MEHHSNLELTSPYKEILTKGKNGVVFFSLGSIVPTDKFPQTYMKNILEIFKKFPDYYFIAKLSKKDNYSRSLAQTIDNIYIADCAPQPQILGKLNTYLLNFKNIQLLINFTFLAHNRLRLFITHGGYNSIKETARSGVPLLGIGMFFDQPRNAKVVEKNGWGLILDKLVLQYSAVEFEEKVRDYQMTNTKQTHCEFNVF